MVMGAELDMHTLPAIQGDMVSPIQTQLRVPANGRFLAMVQNHVRDLATTAGLPAKDVLALELAAEEAFLNIRDHAYPDGAAGDVFVDGAIRQSELHLSFRDEGVPFDSSDELMPRPNAAPASDVARGLGLKLIRHAADVLHWTNHGKQGKALCLVKRLPRPVEPPPAEIAAAIQRAPEQPYDIRPMRPEEALQVARIFWLAYGYSYKNEDFYRPEGLIHLVGSGRLVSFVAVTRQGEVAAHAGLLRPEPVPMAEMAVLVVSPAHRGRRLMEALTEALIAEAGKMGLLGLSFNPVTSHAVSQRQTFALGAKPCGLELAACPPRRFKAMHLSEGSPQRESLLHCFSYLVVPPPAHVHIPDRHRDMVERIYAHLSRPLLPGAVAPAPLLGDYTVAFDRDLQKGTIRVVQAEAGQWPELHRAAVDLVEIAGAEVVELDLPLAQPDTPSLSERAEAAGFFFAGVWPHAAGDGDVLRLTRLASPIDSDQLRFDGDFTQTLARYVNEQRLLTSR
jgi:anti-sigma regulatory factor (Ser/Thr protein kinase)/GNAT superfamily N-acetyltransferase